MTSSKVLNLILLKLIIKYYKPERCSKNITLTFFFNNGPQVAFSMDTCDIQSKEGMVMVD